MTLDSKGLGRLRRVADPRQVWAMEDGDFTPWLAENLDVLADELGLVLSLVATEVPVGNFYLDIKAETEDGRPVIIENQLARTDHGHLGQLVVYASGLEASVVIWVAPEFRDEHRRALDWLNERTDTGVDFFGVQVGVVQISEEGPRAPVFDVVARPNAWQKDVKETSGSTASPAESNPANDQRQDFFGDVLSEVTAQIPSLRSPKRGRASWIAFGNGPFGYWDLSFDRVNQCQVEAYLDMGDQSLNKTLFDEFEREAARWASETGLELEWVRMDNRRASRIAVRGEVVDLQDPRRREQGRAWAVDVTLRMLRTFDERLRARGRELRLSTRSSPTS